MTQTTSLDDVVDIRTAVISEGGKYRYVLSRHWDKSKPACCFVMLNPSTADVLQDDATIRKCCGFAKLWGYGGINVVNLFAYRATDPKELKNVADPIGPDNASALVTVLHEAEFVVCAWGAHGNLLNRAQEFCAKFACHTLHCLDITKAGEPKHPLYVPYTTKPIVYSRKRREI